ncbi:MAG: aminopeptidase P family protein [Chloroflexi bacterium]|nr:aminopeptidase P family protein [Chloroflexota bacterium]
MPDASFPRFTEAEYARRYRIVRAAMARDNLDAIVVFGTRGREAVSVPYLSNFLVTGKAHLVFPIEGEPTLLLQLYNHVPMARRLASIADVRWGGPNSAVTLIAELKARKLETARLGLVGDVPWYEVDLLRQELPGIALVNWTRGFVRCRLVKGQEEIERMLRAAELTDRGMEAIERELRPGLDERDLPRIVENTYLGDWATNEIHYMTTTSMHRPEICVPSQYSAARSIQAGDILITEVSASYWGYPAQILRPYAVAEDPPPLYQQLYDLCERAFTAVADVLKPGATAHQVVDAVQFIEDEGFTIYDDLLHGYGGGYLPPVLRNRATLHEPVPDFTFQENMTVVVQPNVITLDEKAGVQLGHLMRITATGCEPMHRYPRRFTVTAR